MLWRKLILPACLVVVMSTSAFAQNQGGGGGGGGEGGGRRNWNPEQMRQRMMDGFKQDLKATDEEWGILQPKLEAVTAAQRNARAGWGGGRRGGGPGGGDNQQPETELAKASAALRTTLENESASADEIKAKLDALRAAREQANAELEAARAELRELLTQRQEAVLVMRGILE